MLWEREERFAEIQGTLFHLESSPHLPVHLRWYTSGPLPLHLSADDFDGISNTTTIGIHPV